ncbi:secreted RxLR effector peptide protein, putative, partial [Globisporangium polare]
MDAGTTDPDGALRLRALSDADADAASLELLSLIADDGGESTVASATV